MSLTVPWTKLVLCAVALFGGLGGLLADFSDTHLLNPMWPPHAKFHNAQTMSIGMLLALFTLLFAFWRAPESRARWAAMAVLATLYWGSIVCAQFFPGVGFFDPQFADREKILILGHHLTQSEMGLVLVLSVWALVLPRLLRDESVHADVR
ncbi:MAG: hypothetical protein H7Z19_09745 [Chitinophagaceae bacterium]|nr:hypothetical protein [Rubrivivax sp.]